MPAKRKALLKVRRTSKDYYFNYNLRRARVDLNLSIPELAERAGIKAITLYAYERLHAFPNLRAARKIARALHLEPEEIFSKKIREISIEVRKSREKEKGYEKYQPNFVYLGSNLSELEGSLIDMGRKNLVLGEDSTLSQVIQNELGEKIEQILHTLTEKEAEVLRLRYGLGKYKGKEHTLRECKKVLGITPERVRQIEAKAIKRLQYFNRSKILKAFV
jgi:RNA polymerase sigma factor (sigma-70 family)